MKKVYTLFLLALIGLNIYAQTPAWLLTKQATGTGSQEGYGEAMDNAGNIFVTGNFNATMTVGTHTLTCAGYTDMYLVKYDHNGNVLWAVSAGGSDTENGMAVAADALGNIYVVGSFNSPSITFGTTQLTNAGNSYADIFIAKYNANGNLIWAKRVGGTVDDVPIAIAVDRSSLNIYITGYFMSSTFALGATTLTNSGNDDMFVTRMDSSGTFIWAKNALGSGSDMGTAIGVDGIGNVYVSGFTQSTPIHFDTYSFISAGQADMFLAKYNNVGNVVWVKGVGGSGNEYCNSLAVPNVNDIFLTGSYSSPAITFGNITLTNSASGLNDMYVVKYDSSGMAVVAKSVGGIYNDYGYGISANNICEYVAASFNSPQLFIDNDTLNFPTGGFDPTCIIKYDPNLNLICASAIGSGGDDKSSVVVDNADNAFFFGDFYNVSNFVVGHDTLTEPTNTEYFFLAEFNCLTDHVGIKETHAPDKTIIYPNPTNQTLMIRCSAKQAQLSNRLFIILDVLGSQIYSQSLTNSMESTIDITNLNNGIYFFEIKSDKESTKGRFVVQH